MEQKRFGVKTSRIEELILFQLALQHRRLTMSFSTTAKVFAGEEFVEKTVIASQRKITIKPSDRLLDIDNFVLPRQPLVLTGETGIKLRMTDYLNITIKFGTIEERTRFIRALGDLNLLESSIDSDNDGDQQNGPNGILTLNKNGMNG